MPRVESAKGATCKWAQRGHYTPKGRRPPTRSPKKTNGVDHIHISDRVKRKKPLVTTTPKTSAVPQRDLAVNTLRCTNLEPEPSWVRSDFFEPWRLPRRERETQLKK